MFIDTHLHFDDERFQGDLDEVIQRALKEGVGLFISAGTDLSSTRNAIGLAEKFPAIYATAGVHPHSASSVRADSTPPLDACVQPSPGILQQIRELSFHPRVVAIGEVGLDFHYNFSPPDLQREAFRSCIALAIERDLPLVVHSREAGEETVRTLQESGKGKISGVLHAFSEDLRLAKAVIDLGFYLGITGIVTFKNAETLRKVVREVPLEKILLETDAPYLAPQPHRGKRNEPSYLPEVARRVADLKGVSLPEVEEVTSRNASTLFRIPLT